MTVRNPGHDLGGIMFVVVCCMKRFYLLSHTALVAFPAYCLQIAI